MEWILAQASPLGPFAPYVDLGVIVLFFALFAFGKFRRENEVKERDIRIAKLEAQIDKQLLHYQTEVLPALIDATKVCGEVVQLLNKRRT